MAESARGGGSLITPYGYPIKTAPILKTTEPKCGFCSLYSVISVGLGTCLRAPLGGDEAPIGCLNCLIKTRWPFISLCSMDSRLSANVLCTAVYMCLLMFYGQLFVYLVMLY